MTALVFNGLLVFGVKNTDFDKTLYQRNRHFLKMNAD